jgi:cell wall assembly regulator SMI1
MAEPTVTESWQAIVDWLAQHAPAMHATLRAPATEADLSRAQEESGTPLPDDLLEWWRLADGVNIEVGTAGTLIPPYFIPTQVGFALADRLARMEMWGDASAQALGDGARDPDLDAAGTQCIRGWLPKWLPIAYDRSGDDMFVDLRPGPQHGCVMEFNREGAGDQDPTWPSVRTMLADIARGLTTGTATGPYDERAQVTGEGHLEWDG